MFSPNSDQTKAMQVVWLRTVRNSLRIKSSLHASRMWQRTSIWLPKIPKNFNQSLIILLNSENQSPQDLQGNLHDLHDLHERLKTILKKISCLQSLLSIKSSPRTSHSSKTRLSTVRRGSRTTRIIPLANRSSVWTSRRRRRTFKIN